MIHCISIDWLAFFCVCKDGYFCQVSRSDKNDCISTDYSYKVAAYGTRQFRHLVTVSYRNEMICEIQYEPCSSILPPDCVIVKFANRLLYSNLLWTVVDNLLRDHKLIVKNISRVDLCADFNSFETYDPVQLISDFLSSKIRHKGKGLGAAFFNHFNKREKGCSVQHLIYSGIAFGSRESDARAYLYNKTFELKTQKDKPYIRDFWRLAGLDLNKDVWRLEISIKSGGTTFKDKNTGNMIHYSSDELHQPKDLCDLYYTYAKKLFSFVVNRPGITNITREPLIKLFEGTPVYEHGVIRNVSCSTRSERILLKNLWLMPMKYRGIDKDEVGDAAKDIAVHLAERTDLDKWLIDKVSEWQTPLYQ